MDTKRFTVLVVDDISENINLAVSILISNNFNIGIADCGEKALKYAEKNMPDLILLDIMMPEMDGFEVCRRLKNNKLTQNIPIIFLTAKSEKEFIVKGFELGAVDYISKPFFEEELIARVKTHLNLKKANLELEIKNKNITASIQYARLIQKAVLPEESFINHFLPDNFVFYKPRDIVSGDFYWVRQIENQIFISVADCTGHGVPGAFMSMLGIAYLNEIVYNHKSEIELTADNILNTLRQRIKQSLHQDKNNPTISDGMDMALCIINIENRTLQYAGANNPLFLSRFNEQTQQYEIHHYKADRMPIAMYIKEEPFTNNHIELQSNDIIYLFTDGFVDQFGSQSKRKFLSKNFKELLLENCSKPMYEQKEILIQTFDNWRGDYRQVDDVLVFGFKISESYGDIEYF